MKSSEVIKRRVCILLEKKFINDKMTEKTTKIINKFDFFKIVSNTFFTNTKVIKYNVIICVLYIVYTKKHSEPKKIQLVYLKLFGPNSDAAHTLHLALSF